jgi:flagellin-specific chaperone FliS
MIGQGNTKKGDNNINRVYDIITNSNGVLDFKELENHGDNMESDKLP